MTLILRALLILSTAAAVVLQAPAPAARAAYPGANGLLVFEAWGANGFSDFEPTAAAYDLWTVAPDGSSLTNITDSLGADADAQWSPDGTRITFSSNRGGNWDIYTMKPDGSDVQRLTRSPGDESYSTWSPNGRRIAYISERGRQPEIMVMRADGTKKRSLGSFSGTIWHLQWSPAAPRLVFVQESKVEGHFGVNDDEGLRVMNIRTKKVDVLVDHEVPEFDPVWSPDGRFIAFARDYCTDGVCDNSEIMKIRPDGSGLKRITRTPGTVEFDPAWSPDGSKIAYAGYESDSLWWEIELFVMEADGSGPVQLVMKPDSLDYQVDWQPLP